MSLSVSRPKLLFQHQEKISANNNPVTAAPATHQLDNNSNFSTASSTGESIKEEQQNSHCPLYLCPSNQQVQQVAAQVRRVQCTCCHCTGVSTLITNPCLHHSPPNYHRHYHHKHRQHTFNNNNNNYNRQHRVRKMSLAAGDNKPQDKKHDKRRPPKLQLSSSNTAPSPTTDDSVAGASANLQSLKTPQEIANDIAIQCVSPGIPNFMSSETRDAFIISRNIEAEQRRLIAARMSDTLTPATPPKFAKQKEKDDEELQRPLSASLKSTSRRKAPPSRLNLGAQSAQQQPLINSAPLARIATSPPKPSQKSTIGRSISVPKGLQARQQLPSPSQQQQQQSRENGALNTTTIFVKHRALQDRGAKTSVPPENKSWLLSTQPPSSYSHQRSRSIEELQALRKRQLAEEEEDDDEEEEEDDNDRDPEDAALSDDEKDDKPAKRQKTDNENDNDNTQRQRQRHHEPTRQTNTNDNNDTTTGAAYPCMSTPLTPPTNSAPLQPAAAAREPPQERQVSAREKKHRFMQLCSEMWDLMQS